MDLVTGATGFIGRHLAARLLREGREVRVLCRNAARVDPGLLGSGSGSGSGFGSGSGSGSRSGSGSGSGGVEVVVGDLNDRDSLIRAAAGVDRVFHCAGQVADWGRAEEFEAANVRGTQWLLEASRGVRRFIHLSSIAVFGVPSPPYFDDSSPYGPGKDLYSRTKIAGEKLVLSQRDVEVAVLRPPVVYGPHGAWLEEPLRMIQNGKMFLLGGGRGTCHPCYIENLVDALLLVADHPKAAGQAYIVGDGRPLTFRQYFNEVSHIAGKGEIERSIPLPVARAMATAFEATARLTGATSRPLLTHTAIDMVCTQSGMSMEKIQRDLGFAPRFTTAAAMSALREQSQQKNG